MAKSTSIFTLPLKVRLRIYESHRSDDEDWTAGSDLQLCHVSRQVRAEVTQCVLPARRITVDLYEAICRWSRFAIDLRATVRIVHVSLVGDIIDPQSQPRLYCTPNFISRAHQLVKMVEHLSAVEVVAVSIRHDSSWEICQSGGEVHLESLTLCPSLKSIRILPSYSYRCFKDWEGSVARYQAKMKHLLEARAGITPHDCTGDPPVITGQQAGFSAIHQ